jgi:hypothetical protein
MPYCAHSIAILSAPLSNSRALRRLRSVFVRLGAVVNAPCCAGRWEDQGFFQPNPNATGEPFVISMPPPNVTGKLHMGHAMFATLQDIMIRYARMTGRKALWIPGTDHAGIATQVSQAWRGCVRVCSTHLAGSSPGQRARLLLLLLLGCCMAHGATRAAGWWPLLSSQVAFA